MVSELGQVWRWSLSMGGVIPILSLMLGLLVQEVCFEMASNIPSVIRQDAHISLPLCKIFPPLYGCEPGVGALTGLQVWELSQKVGQVVGLLVNLILVGVISIWITVRPRFEGALTGMLMGLVSVFSSLVLAWIFDVPLDIRSFWGIFGILMISALPLSGLMGTRIGKNKIANRLTRGSVSFFPGEEALQMEWFGESLSKRELEVLALVAQGFKNREIAQRLYVSQATIKTHLVHIFTKLGVDSRTAAVTKALACGLLHQEEKETEP